ncbi:hypothetical protein D3C72_1263170 [compost metagenome]
MRQRVRQPQGGKQRIAQTGGSGTHRNRFASPLQHHAAAQQIDVLQQHRAVAQHEQTAGGVIGNGVRQRDIPAGDAAINHFESGQQIGGGADQVGERVFFMGQIPFKYQGDLGFHLGLNQPTGGNLFTVTQRHVGEQLAEIRLIDPQLALYRRRRQPDFAAHRPVSLLDPLLVIDPLYGIGGIDIL